MSALVLLGGAVSAMLTGGGWTWPAGSDLLRTVAGVVGHPGTPAAGYPPALQPRIPGPVPFWITVGLLAGVLVILATAAVVAMWGRRPPSGSLTRAQMRQAMQHTHLLAPFGRYHGIPVQGQPGDAAICIAPQQAGKTTRLAIGRVADAPGACLVTSTKADIVDATIYVRHNTAAPFIILREDPQAEPGWVEDLTKYTRGAAPE
ncbi:MAG: hypothetical protein WCG47_14045, partial [Dermatophilaceae bacterium]